MLSVALGTFGCQDLDRFDTTGDDAYCGEIVSAQFVRTTAADGGFARGLRVRLELDAGALSTVPGVLTTDDATDGPCQPGATFDRSELRATPEIQHDGLSTLHFGDAQEHNVIAWVDSSCRGPMLAVVSLLASDNVELRLLKPADPAVDETRPAFALFELSRRAEDCGF